MNDLLIIKKKLAQAIRTLHGGGILTLTVGHVSYRLSEERIAILGHTHKIFKTLDMITEGEIIIMDLDGNTIEGKYEPPGEKYIHTEIYKKRPDIRSIVHGHPEISIAFSVAGVGIVPVYYRAGQFQREIPIMDFSGQINTKKLGQQAAESLGQSLALLLRGHGVIIVGGSIEEASVNAFALETNARIQLYASILGSPRPIRVEELGTHRPTSVWQYYIQRYDSMLKKIY